MRSFIWLVLIVFAFSTVSCQDEGETVSQDTTNSFSKTSPISSLIKRVSQYETTGDNVLDGTSNCSIQLPVHVTVNGHYIYVADSSDFQQVEYAKDNYPGDDVVHFDFNYNVSIIYPNYDAYAISSQTQLDYIFSHYGDDSPYRDIDCLDFDYPFYINLYNTNNQVGSTLKINNDSQLYNFIDDLNTAQIVGIVFPLYLTKTNGQHLTINNNSQLEDAIEAAVTDCSTTTTTTPLQDIISSGTWHVTYFFDSAEETSYYNGYNFTFNTNGTTLAVKNSISTQGDWVLQTQMGHQYFTLHFNNEPQELHELETNWEVMEYTSTYLRLRHEEGGGECHYLYFAKN